LATAHTSYRVGIPYAILSLPKVSEAIPGLVLDKQSFSFLLEARLITGQREISLRRFGPRGSMAIAPLKVVWPSILDVIGSVEAGKL
jgi:hypothetical protein